MGLFVYGLISILAAIALPAYQDYIAKSQVAEAFTLADGLKTSIGTNRQSGSCFANAATSAGTEDKIVGKYGTATILEEKPKGTATGLTCGIHYKFDQAKVSDLIKNKNVTLKLDSDSGTLKLDAVKGAAATDIPTKYLPSAFQ
ncbi:fimbrial subunit FimA [Moraxella macacae 0408225]|uniref:Fimbrial subunit FimA n=2 Tax=Moraxella macacae 0408225 TaxID=1230338 RepID=L2F6A8_9GAMM|nr:fimbrial subunit FimA [Moraxella macacae 0408225]